MLFLLLMFWLITLLHRGWRQVLWDDGVSQWAELQAALDGTITRRRAGWRIRGTQGDLQVRGGVFPVESRLKLPGGQVHKTDGIATPAWVRAQLDQA